MATQYERLKVMSAATKAKTQGGPVVVHANGIQWEQGPGGHRRRAFISEPDILGSMVQTIAAFLSEMPAGGRSGKHRHFNDAMIFVLKARPQHHRRRPHREAVRLGRGRPRVGAGVRVAPAL